MDLEYSGEVFFTACSRENCLIFVFYSKQEFTNLKCLKNLKTLSFADPIYDSSPIASLSNYRPFTIFSFPYLKSLDSYAVDEQEVNFTEVIYCFTEEIIFVLKQI